MHRFERAEGPCSHLTPRTGAGSGGYCYPLGLSDLGTGARACHTPAPMPPGLLGIQEAPKTPPPPAAAAAAWNTCPHRAGDLPPCPSLCGLPTRLGVCGGRPLCPQGPNRFLRGLCARRGPGRGQILAAQLCQELSNSFWGSAGSSERPRAAARSHCEPTALEQEWGRAPQLEGAVVSPPGRAGLCHGGVLPAPPTAKR